MFEAIANAYPHLCSAMRRRYGMQPQETAALILSARYPGRCSVWTSADCDKARAMLRGAFSARLRPCAA